MQYRLEASVVCGADLTLFYCIILENYHLSLCFRDGVILKNYK